MNNRTLVLVKPDAIERGLLGEIIGRLERKGLHIIAGEIRTIGRDVAELHYAEHKDKPFYEELVSFITRSTLMAMVVEGPDDTWHIVRNMMGATDPADAAPGTIRGDLSCLLTENLIHGSDSADSAEREIALFFPEYSAP